MTKHYSEKKRLSYTNFTNELNPGTTMGISVPAPLIETHLIIHERGKTGFDYYKQNNPWLSLTRRLYDILDDTISMYSWLFGAKEINHILETTSPVDNSLQMTKSIDCFI